MNSVIYFAVDALSRERDTYVFVWGITSAQYAQNAVVSDVRVRWESQPAVKRVLGYCLRLARYRVHGDGDEEGATERGSRHGEPSAGGRG